MGPPPATRPTPTSHCERIAFSRLAKLMSQARASSLPFPVARPRIMAIVAKGARVRRTRISGHEFESGGPLRYSGQILEFGEEIAVVEEESFDGAVEYHDLDLLVGLEGRHDLAKLENEFRAHQIQGRIVQRDPPIGWRRPGDPDLRGLRRCVHNSLPRQLPEQYSILTSAPEGRYCTNVSPRPWYRADARADDEFPHWRPTGSRAEFHSMAP